MKLADSHAKRPPARAVTPDAEPAIVQTARDQLRRSLYPGLRHVDCRFAHGRLHLSGRLRSYFEKQLAQETVAHLPGVIEIVNEIDVCYPQPLTRSQQASNGLQTTGSLRNACSRLG